MKGSYKCFDIFDPRYAWEDLAIATLWLWSIVRRTLFYNDMWMRMF